MQEIEAKFYVQDLKKIEMRIQELGAHLIHPRMFETNLRFDQPDGRLRAEGQVLRLRQDTEARLTYKGRGMNENGIVSRTEIEFTVEAFEKARLFVEALGYQKIMQYDKYRTTYTLESESSLAPPARAGVLPIFRREVDGIQSCHIMLDELPYGNFIEIEGEDVDSIRVVANVLYLNMDKALSTSYFALFEQVKQTLGLTFNDLTFGNFKDIKVSVNDLQVKPADI